MSEPKSYKDTVNLPQTSFNMRANAVQKEPELQKFWTENQIYEKLAENNPKELFVLHDGPPYANGDLHMGHALNKVLKDIINKYKLLQGHKVRYVPGWDCHGLPIELKVLQSIPEEKRPKLSPIKLRYKARDFALKTQKKQAEGFKRYGIWGDWENPYLTLKPEYEAAQIEVFGKMAINGYIYRGLKPVHWSPSSQTALAEAELEYPEGHTSRSIYASFTITKLSDKASHLEQYMPNLGVAIWTTTPWTIPGNLAVAVNGKLDYAVVEVVAGENDSLVKQGQYLIVAQDLVENLGNTFGVTLEVKTTVKGADLELSTYKHPLFDRESPVVIGGDYITTESGTGLVHTAPGHGQEDYITGQKYHLPILSPVDNKGNFTEEAGEFAGLNVLKDANQAIIDALTDKGSLLKEEAYQHKYPYDWRTKKPTIFRATEQWFASVDGFREEALKAIKEVNWIPAQGENRITPMVSERNDWCISRQRSWGLPIPVFYDEETNEPLLNEETINHVRDIIREKGSDAWWLMSVEELLPESYRNNGKTYRKGMDTMDVWFDSGSSWAAVANQREELKYPVDLYLEGSDQHRGWFQSSLLTSVAVNGHAPYKTVLTHGFVLDEKGMKMSKSIGNVVDPNLIINGGKNQKQQPPYGADVLRLWVSSTDYSGDVRIGDSIIKQLADVYRKIRNTARFLIGSLHDFDPTKNAVSYADLPELDKYILHETHQVFTEITEAYDSFQFFKFFQKVQNFCVVDLSNFYLDVAKDRLYISDLDSARRRSCQTVMAIILENLARAIAPVLCHMAEDIWQNLPYQKPCNSVFEAGWLKLESEWVQSPEFVQKWQELRHIRTGVNKILDDARNQKLIGASLEAKVLVYDTTGKLADTLASLNPDDALNDGNRVDELRYLLLVSQVELVDDESALDVSDYRGEITLTDTTLKVAVVNAEGRKCDRCWNYSNSVGTFVDEPLICNRCKEALVGNF
ncbi:isoleucine--tRNA ligase [Cyanobacterium stanieri LEGE 03274]|uniref:Isoleucine--tRNA ligase n=1 Tax=Cyanobacterium stanieri LEGE 03274 TaxID=1828756 RepID=A0ABR9V3X0_9CHRO|nr:isoleucine--tRNA ligase [Cyanobacterium stanieri]MBE9222582.1 isoleucine--tRNA ligase [Cyanobacterium stanieri LEGE 03274]